MLGCSAMTAKIPPGYLAVNFPARFALEVQLDNGVWITEVTATPNDFDRLADGSYICSSGASGLWVRCIEDRGEHFIHVDGSGERFRYRLVDLDGPPATSP